MLPRVTNRREVPVDHDHRLETEQLIQRGRVVAWLIAVGLVLAISIDRVVGGGLTAAVAVLTANVVGTHLVLRRARTARNIVMLGWVSFAGDVLVCAAALSGTVGDPVDPIVFITMLIAVEAGIRWGPGGAVTGGALAGALGVVWAQLGYTAIGRDLPLTSVVFRTIAPVLIALPVGLIVERLRRQRGYTQLLFEHTSDPMIVLAGDRILAINPAAAQLTDRSVQQLRGAPFSRLLGPLLEIEDPVTLIDQPQSSPHDVPVADGQGGQRWWSLTATVAAGDLLLLTARDVTEERLREQHLSFRAWHDPLTGLLNREALQVRLADLLRVEAASGVIFLDLDGFKPINDQHGHDVGDAVLVEVAVRIREVVRDDDAVYRWGGDEFCIVLPAADPALLQTIADRVEAVLNADLEVAGHSLCIGASIGTAMAEPGDNPAILIKRADARMYAQKASRSSARDTSSPRG